LLSLTTKYVGFGLKLTVNDSMSLQELLDSTGKTKRSTEKVLDKLKSTNAIEQLLEGVDVRKDAYSKQDVSYSEGALSRILADAKIKYIHVPELGVDYNLREELRSTHDYETYFNRYMDYLEKNSNLTELVAGLAKNNVICLMCYEKDFRRCHRSVLANKLQELGITFYHM